MANHNRNQQAGSCEVSDNGCKIGVRITEELNRKIEVEAEHRGVDKSVALREICRDVLAENQSD